MRRVRRTIMFYLQRPMIAIKEEYQITDDKSELQIDRVKFLLSTSYWAKDRDEETINISIENSVCFSVFHLGVQIGFARVVTDFASVAYIADVIIAKAYQSNGLGKWLVETIVNDERWNKKFLILATDDAQKLYEKYGFSGSCKLMSTKI